MITKLIIISLIYYQLLCATLQHKKASYLVSYYTLTLPQKQSLATVYSWTRITATYFVIDIVGSVKKTDLIKQLNEGQLVQETYLLC